MKILLVSHSNFVGGAELCFIEILQSLDSSGENKIFAVFPSIKGSLKEMCKSYCKEVFTQYLPFWTYDGVRISFIKKLSQFISLVSSVRKAHQLIRRIDPDLIITNTSVIPQYAIASKLSRSKHIWFIHELVDEDFGQHFVFGKQFSKWMIGYLSDKVVTNSLFVNSRYISIVKDSKLVMLYQPVSLNYIQIEETIIDKPILELLIIGKVCDFKGQHEAILACNELLRRGVCFRLTIVGTASETYIDYLRGLMLDGVSDFVNFVPFTNKPEHYYQLADIVLVCSRCEALGRITIEAMKMGLPVLASDKGGNIELIRNGVTGYLYKYGNPVDLADKIMILEDSLKRKKIGRNGKEFANKQFNMNNFSKEFESLIQSILNK